MTSSTKNSSNTNPSIYLIAICGTGMASLAGLFKEKGCQVTGSDANIYPPMSDQLAALGIKVKAGYRAENIPTSPPDFVVVGNAVSKGNEEVAAAEAAGIPLLSMPESLERFFLADRSPIVVAGTHGKTTTCGLLAWLLERTGQSPGFLVGGLLKDFGRSYQLGTGRLFVVEGDEYDSAFFDKGPKFLHYHPKILILNSVEFDHADIYRDLDHLMQSFSRLIGTMDGSSLILADGESPNVRTLIAQANSRVVTFGLTEGVDLQADRIELGEGVRFRLLREGREIGHFASPLPGRHNLKNLLAALGVLLEQRIPIEGISRPLAEFQGIKRRQEVLATINGIVLVDDFAHHPTAVRETLTALRSRYGKRKLWAIFEPRSNTTRRSIFQKEFVGAFGAADEVMIAPPYQPEKIPEGERLDPGRLAEDLVRRGQRARHLRSVDEIVLEVSKEASAGDVICFMSNGAFGGIYEKMIQKLKEM